MVFSSAPFLFIFLPVILIVYTCIRNLKAQNVLLIIASLFFYAYGAPYFVIVMVVFVFINYLLARLIAGRAGKRKVFLVISIIADLGLIGVFKYTTFIVETFNKFSQAHVSVTDIMTPIVEIFNRFSPADVSVPDSITLPIGISFFTFQMLSYVIDVYRDPQMVQKSFPKVLLYVSFFPQLIAGPIVKYHDVYTYINSRRQTPDEVAKGIRRFILGLGKKLLLADTVAVAADAIFDLDAGSLSVPVAWIGAICYVLQIFFDFSGYSDMAIGLGHMFGFTFLENFDHPYTATSIKGFWRRWHISLSTWFREYLYIPLGGNRKGKVRTEVNKLIVFFLTGLWHGASWNFVLWGMIHGVANVCEDVVGNIRRKHRAAKTGTKASVHTDQEDIFANQEIGTTAAAAKHAGPKKDERPVPMRVIGWIYTMLIVTVAFTFFHGDGMKEGLRMFKAMFAGGFGNAAAYNACIEVMTPFAIAVFVIAIVCCAPILRKIEIKAAAAGEKAARRVSILSYVLAVVLLLLCILTVASSTYSPFIYFRF